MQAERFDGDIRVKYSRGSCSFSDRHPPKYSVSSIMGFLKGKLSIRLFQRYERISKQYWGRHFWSRGYCVSTVGLDEERIRKYVKWQEKREKDNEKEQLN